MKRNFSVQTTLRLEVDFFERLKKEGESHRRGMTGVIEDLMADAWFRKTDVAPTSLPQFGMRRSISLMRANSSAKSILLRMRNRVRAELRSLDTQLLHLESDQPKSPGIVIPFTPKEPTPPLYTPPCPCQESRPLPCEERLPCPNSYRAAGR